LGALLALGDIAFDRHDFALAKTWFEKGLELAHRHGSEEAIGIALIVLGRVAYAEGDYARATSLYEESVRRGGAALNELGKVALAQANYAQAATLFRRCLQQYSEYLHLTLFSLEGLGAVAAEQGDAQRAARLWGAVQAQRALADLPRDAIDTPDYERWVAAAQARFDPETFAAAWQAGRALSLEEAVAEALLDADERG
jgi:tetratricopeptide (TPR) repeat protein